MITRTAVSVVLVLLGAALPAGAQEPSAALASTLAPGDRVRVTTNTMSIPSRGLMVKEDKGAIKLVGVVDRVDAGVLMIVLADTDAVQVPIASISAVDVHAGKKRHWLWGLSVGVAVGLGAGLSATVDARNCAGSSNNFCSRGEALGVTMLVGGGMGTALGALLKTDQWARRYP